MSHFIIEQGDEVGKEISVPSSGIKFGRSPANDLVLAEESVMLFQGRFFFKSDGSLWVTDFSAAEKTTVGGEPIDEHALSVGELVEVGSTAFRVIGVKLGEDGSAVSEAPVVEKKADEEIDLGFKASEHAPKRKVAKDSDQKPHTMGHRLLQVAIVMLVMLVVALAAREIMDVKGPAVAPASKHAENISFAYECVRGNYKDIFRYSIELMPDGNATIEIDNLGNRHNTKTAVVSKEALDKLSRRIDGSGFFDISRNYVIDSPNGYTYYDLSIYCNGRFNHVIVLNKEMPEDLRRTISIVEKFIFDELEVSSTLLEDEETLIRKATEDFRLGKDFYSERDVKIGNLALAIVQYEEALDSLETLDLKPLLNEQIKMGLRDAKSEQELRYKDFKFNADRAVRLGDWREADRQLRILAELVPDRDDHRHDAIISMQLEVEEHLR